MRRRTRAARTSASRTAARAAWQARRWRRAPPRAIGIAGDGDPCRSMASDASRATTLPAVGVERRGADREAHERAPAPAGGDLALARSVAGDRAAGDVGRRVDRRAGRRRSAAVDDHRVAAARPCAMNQSSPYQSPTRRAASRALPSLPTTQTKWPLALCCTARCGTRIAWAARRRSGARARTGSAAARRADCRPTRAAGTCRSAGCTRSANVIRPV